MVKSTQHGANLGSRPKSRRANSKRTRPGGPKATCQSRRAFEYASRLRWHQTMLSLFQPRKSWLWSGWSSTISTRRPMAANGYLAIVTVRRCVAVPNGAVTAKAITMYPRLRWVMTPVMTASSMVTCENTVVMNFAFAADKRQNFQPCPADNQLDFDRLQ